ncbi:MAG TPA: hypothetical protein VGP72_26460 [Planctomycetota bacterium]|jgi:hypothetical protein
MDLIGLPGRGIEVIMLLVCAACLLPLAAVTIMALGRIFRGQTVARGFRRAALPIFVPAAYSLACFIVPPIGETCLSGIPAIVSLVFVLWAVIAFDTGCALAEATNSTTENNNKSA